MLIDGCVNNDVVVCKMDLFNFISCECIAYSISVLFVICFYCVCVLSAFIYSDVVLLEVEAFFLFLSSPIFIFTSQDFPNHVVLSVVESKQLHSLHAKKMQSNSLLAQNPIIFIRMLLNPS